MLDNLNKKLEAIKINISEIIEADKNKKIHTLYDRNIRIIYDEIDESPIVKIKSNNKNYVIICDKISNNYDNVRIILMGKKNGNLIIENNENYACFAHHKSKGDGHIIILGSGYCDVRRINKGNGHAIRLGSGEGDSNRANEGHGYAIRMGTGKGNAVRSGSGNGDAWRLDKGIGNAIRSRSEVAEDYLKKDSKGHAIKSGSGNGNANNNIYIKSCALKLGSGMGFAYS